MTAIGLDSLQTRSTLTAGGKTVDYFSIAKLSEKWFGRVPGPDSLERVITPGYGVPGMPGYDPTPHELKCG